jgi:hypothetical protein
MVLTDGTSYAIFLNPAKRRLMESGDPAAQMIWKGFDFPTAHK